MHEAEPDNSILNMSGFRPGDVLFITRRGGMTPLNLVAQRVKRWTTRKREPFVGYAHVALAIGQDQVIHSTVSAKGSKQPQGVTVQSIYELAPDPSTSWEVLRRNTGHPALDSVRDAALAYIGFAYNDRFDLKQLFPNIKYTFAVYCSEFIAAIFSELELINKPLVPHKTTPNLLYDTLVNSGWIRVANNSFDFYPDPEWAQSSGRSAALRFSVARNIIGQTLSTNKLLIEFLNANRAMVDIDKDGSLALQTYFQLGSRNLVSLPVTFRARLAMSQLSTMAIVDDEGRSYAESDASGATISAADYKIKQWADLALKVHTLQWHSLMVDHFFSFEANVTTELVTRVMLTLNETADKQKDALEDLYRSASALCHYFHIHDLRFQLEEFSERSKLSKHAFLPAISFLQSILYFYINIESLLAIAGPVVMARLDVTSDIVKCLEAVARAYEALQPHISIVEKEGQLAVSVEAAVTTSRAADTVIAELRRRLTNPGKPAEGQVGSETLPVNAAARDK